MSIRMIVAVLAGAVLMYVWASGMHMSPVGMTGFQQLKDDPAVATGMTSATGGKAGLYSYPFVSEAEMKDMKAVQAKYDANPSGLVIYNPPGSKAMTTSQLVLEFLLELFETILAVWLLSRAGVGDFKGRMIFMAGLGVLAAVVTNASYAVWYHFPVDYTLANMLIEFGKFVFAGLGFAAVLKYWKAPAGA